MKVTCSANGTITVVIRQVTDSTVLMHVVIWTSRLPNYRIESQYFRFLRCEEITVGSCRRSFGASQLWQAAYSSPSDAFLPRYSDGTWGYYKPNSQGAPNSVLNLANAGYEMLTTTRVNTDFVLEQDLSFLVKGLRASAMISWDNVLWKPVVVSMT